MILRKSFYQLPTITIAKQLLGTFLIHDSPQGKTVGRIVETEAYLFRDDPACHAHRGMTKRNAAMFGRAGSSYVYLIYGMYRCFNVVTAAKGVGEAVLVRALEPIEGLQLMQERRGTNKLKNLCSGPGKLAMAMGIGAEHDGLSLMRGALRIVDRVPIDGVSKSEPASECVVTTTRVGISVGVELPLRFYLAENDFISKK